MSLTRVVSRCRGVPGKGHVQAESLPVGCVAAERDSTLAEAKCLQNACRTLAERGLPSSTSNPGLDRASSEAYSPLYEAQMFGFIPPITQEGSTHGDSAHDYGRISWRVDVEGASRLEERRGATHRSHGVSGAHGRWRAERSTPACAEEEALAPQVRPLDPPDTLVGDDRDLDLTAARRHGPRVAQCPVREPLRVDRGPRDEDRPVDHVL